MIIPSFVIRFLSNKTDNPVTIRSFASSQKNKGDGSYRPPCSLRQSIQRDYCSITASSAVYFSREFSFT